MEQNTDYRCRIAQQFNAGLQDCLAGEVYGTTSNANTEAAPKGDPTLLDQYSRGWDTGIVRRLRKSFNSPVVG